MFPFQRYNASLNEFTNANIIYPAKQPRVHIHHQNENPVLAALSNINPLSAIWTPRSNIWIFCLPVHPKTHLPSLDCRMSHRQPRHLACNPLSSCCTEPWELQFQPEFFLFLSAAAGNDANLVKIILCSADSSGRRMVNCGDVSVILKKSDPRHE